MPISCSQCAHAIFPNEGILPPWCPRCGADFKPGNGVSGPEALPTQRFVAISSDSSQQCSVLETPYAQADFAPHPVVDSDDSACPSCLTRVEIADWAADTVACCPECGQCLKAPTPWMPSGRERVPLRGWPNPEKKYTGNVGVTVGCLLAGAVALIPGIEIFLRLAGVMFGAALFVEGMGRIRREEQKRQPLRNAHLLDLPQELPQEVYGLGCLKAVFRTANSWGDALAVLCVGLAFASLEGCLIVWLKHGAVHPKLFIAALLAPVLVLYLFYRAARKLIERRRLFVFTGGLVSCRGSRMEVIPWDKVDDVSQTFLGDAIDEHAVEIRLKFGRAPLRYTCSHFLNLDKLWDRLQHEFPRRRQEPADRHDS